MRDDRVSFDIEAAKLVTVGHVHADSAWSMPAHAHTYWEFIYFVRGSGRVNLPNASLRPQPYHIVVYPPGLPHAEVANPTDPEETLFFGVDMPGTPPVGAHLLLADPQGDLRWLCQRLSAECQSHGMTPLAETYMRAFLYLLERAWGSGIPVQHDAVDIAVQYMHENHSQDITLGVLAQVAHVSETHLAHRFSARLGISPLRHLQHIRIESAKRLLATTSTAVNEVAENVGFSDPLYFSRVFKRSTGMSPSSFRRQTNCTTQSMSSATASIPEDGETGL